VEGIRPVATSQIFATIPRVACRCAITREAGPASRRPGISADVQSAAARGTAVGDWLGCPGHDPGSAWIEPPPAGAASSPARTTNAAGAGSGNATALHVVEIHDGAVKQRAACPDGRAGASPPAGR
jgi:hypothetical protein